MRARWQWIVVLFLALGLPLLACSLLVDEAVVPTVAPTAERDSAPDDTSDVPQPENGEGGPGLPALSALEEQLAGYNSYRIRIQVTFVDSAAGEDGGTSGSMVLERVRTINPPASRLTLKSGGALTEELDEAASEGELSFVELGGETYSVIPGAGCFAGQEEAANVTEGFTDVLDSQELLGSVQRSDLIGEETVNGQTVDHYRFDQDDVVSTATSLQGVSGDLYMSQEGDYPVRIVYEGVGRTDLFGSGSLQDGRLRVEYNVFDVGVPLQIELPVECGEATTAYPIMENARELSTMAGFVTYRVDASLEEVVDFYQQEMQGLGYVATDEQVILEQTAILQFASEERPDASVAITAETGEVLVLITTEESE